MVMSLFAVGNRVRLANLDSGSLGRVELVVDFKTWIGYVINWDDYPGDRSIYGFDELELMS